MKTYRQPRAGHSQPASMHYIAWLNSTLDSLAARIYADGRRAGLSKGGARERSRLIRTYLALAVSNFAQRSTSLVTWESQHGKPRYTFTRQAIPMVWDYAEVNPLGPSGIERCIEQICAVLERLPPDAPPGHVAQVLAQEGWALTEREASDA